MDIEKTKIILAHVPHKSIIDSRGCCCMLQNYNQRYIPHFQMPCKQATGSSIQNQLWALLLGLARHAQRALGST